MEKFGSGMEKSRIRELEPTLPEEDECRHGGNAVSSSGVLALVHVNLRATVAITNTLACRDPDPHLFLAIYSDLSLALTAQS
jgi:hypothetical protein